MRLPKEASSRSAGEPTGGSSATAHVIPTTRASTFIANFRRLWQPPFLGTRARVITFLIVVMAVSEVAAVLVIDRVLKVGLESEISRELTQETEEFRRLAGGRDPRTGEPFGLDLKAIYDVYFSRNVPNEGEALVALINGRPYASNYAHDAPYRLEDDPDLLARLSNLTEAERGELSTPLGDARYLAVPIDGARRGRRIQGTFVVANFPAFERQEINDAVRVASGVSLLVFVVASLIAWFSTGRLLSPLRELAETARSITESNLKRRIPVRGRDELSQMARRFNEMLDRLEASFELQREFTDDAGHELRTPITIIRGHLELMDDDPAERQKTVALVLDELDRMSRMVEELLTLAKAERPDFLQSHGIDVASFTDELFTKARALGPREWALEGVGKGVITADGQRLTQALVQLAQNATQHTSEGDTIPLGSATADETARFWVRDTGPGIAPEDQDHIFQRFGRGRTVRRSDGTGLGLAIVRAIAEAHGGYVELRSRVGAGATFTIVVPARPPSGPALEDAP